MPPTPAIADPRLCQFHRPLHIAALIKQIPVGESMMLGQDGRLVRAGFDLEMNAYCRRAVSRGVEWATASRGTSTVFTLGPPSAEEILREAIAWGADRGVHLCDPLFRGSDTLATARALASGLRQAGHFDLIFVGLNSLDGDTGQVGPELAELLHLPFATGVRQMSLLREELTLTLEHDDGSDEVVVSLPALLSVAERLCEPCKVDPARRAEVSAERIQTITASELGVGPWGQDGSPTQVGRIHAVLQERAGKILSGTISEQVVAAVSLLAQREALSPSGAELESAGLVEEKERARGRPNGGGGTIAVLIEPDRPRVGLELLGVSSRLAASINAKVHALAFSGIDQSELGRSGADEITIFTGTPNAEDVAASITEWSLLVAPWALIGPSTAFGREVLGRLAAALGAGLIGDAIDLEIEEGELVAAKPAFSGAVVADIRCTSDVRLVSIRPGVLPFPSKRVYDPVVSSFRIEPRSRLRQVSQRRDDDVEILARAQVVIGLGAGVQPHEYEEFSPLAELLGAELGATRKVTDSGWAPKARQIGITGRSIAPRLYVAVGIAGKFNHMVGVRGAGTIVAINSDPNAPVFPQSDIGILGDWHHVLPVLTAALREYAAHRALSDSPH